MLLYISISISSGHLKIQLYKLCSIYISLYGTLVVLMQFISYSILSYNFTPLWECRWIKASFWAKVPTASSDGAGGSAEWPGSTHTVCLPSRANGLNLTTSEKCIFTTPLNSKHQVVLQREDNHEEVSGVLVLRVATRVTSRTQLLPLWVLLTQAFEGEFQHSSQ